MTQPEIDKLQGWLARKAQLENDIEWYQSVLHEVGFGHQITWGGRIYDIPDTVCRSYMRNELEGKIEDLKEIDHLFEKLKVSNLP